jgi:dynein heavy chain
MTYWTSEVHKAIAEGVAAMKAYLEKCNYQIGKIVDLVRGKLNTQNRITLGRISGFRKFAAA